MIKNNEILFTKSLHRKFIKCVQEVEGVDCSKYRSHNLKTRLKSTFPTLVIHRSFTKNAIDFVYSQSLTAKELVQTAVGSNTLCTDTDIGSSEGAGEAQRFSHESVYLHTLFNASAVLYNTYNEEITWHYSCPGYQLQMTYPCRLLNKWASNFQSPALFILH